MGTKVFLKPVDGMMYSYDCFVRKSDGSRDPESSGFVFRLLEQKQGNTVVDYKFAFQHVEPGAEIKDIPLKDYVSLRSTVKDYMVPEFGMDNPYVSYVKPRMARRIALDSMESTYEKIVEWAGIPKEQQLNSNVPNRDLHYVFLDELRKNSQKAYSRIASIETAQKNFETAKQELESRRQLIHIDGLTDDPSKDEPSSQV